MQFLRSGDQTSFGRDLFSLASLMISGLWEENSNARISGKQWFQSRYGWFHIDCVSRRHIILVDMNFPTFRSRLAL